MVSISWTGRELGRAVFGRDPRARYEARFSLISRVARRTGFEIYNRHLWWFDDDEFRKEWADFPEGDGKIRDRKYLLWHLARSVTCLPGETAECGAYTGGSSFLIARVDPGTTHHIFDSFEGLSTPIEADRPARVEATPWAKGDLSIDETRVLQNLAGSDVRTYKGWIPERFSEVADRQFRLVHIDVDLFEPTRDSLDFFWPRLVAGGMVVCDDYGSTLCPGATRAMDEHASKTNHTVIHVPTGQGLIIKHH